MKALHIALIAAAAIPATAAGDDALSPGQWTVTVAMRSVIIPGAPPSVGDAMRTPARTFSQCLTATNTSDAMQEILRAAPGCSFASFSMAGGQMSAEMRCSQRGGTMVARTTGTYTATSFTATSEATVTGPMTMNISTRTTGRRLGECF